MCCHKSSKYTRKASYVNRSQKEKRHPDFPNHSVSRFQCSSEGKLQPLAIFLYDYLLMKEAVLRRVPPLLMLILCAVKLVFNFCLPASSLVACKIKHGFTVSWEIVGK